MLVMYGFAKINGSQFTVVDWVLDEPLEMVSGFWLTWYYFSFSEGYKWMVALAEIGGGMLLLFRRTALVAALVMTGAMLNILLINVFFSIDLGALFMASLITLNLLVIIGFHKEELIRVFWVDQVDEGTPTQINPSMNFVKWPLRIAVLAIPFYLTWWIANFNNQLPTKIDGTWDVAETLPDTLSHALPDRYYFERNRAYMARFRKDGALLPDHYHFQTVAGPDSLYIWKGWLSKDSAYFTGTFQLNGDVLTIYGDFEAHEMPVEITLKRYR